MVAGMNHSAALAQRRELGVQTSAQPCKGNPPHAASAELWLVVELVQHLRWKVKRLHLRWKVQRLEEVQRLEQVQRLQQEALARALRPPLLKAARR